MNHSTTHWQIGPFTRHPEPVLRADPALMWKCPVLGEPIPWSNVAIFNPAAVVADGRVCVLFRAECHLDGVNHGCRIGLAWSDNGIDFTCENDPILYRDHDSASDFEWPMGCEDPRIARRDDGLWVLTYTGFDLRTARLCVATSPDLRTWTKHGLAFGHFDGGRYRQFWCKAGSIVCRREGDQLIAQKIRGKYWMYFGEGLLYAATSDDLIHWEPVEYEAGAHKIAYMKKNRTWDRSEPIPGVRSLKPVVFPRTGRYDEDLCEPGPAAVLTSQGIVLIYNGSRPVARGGQGYTGGQILFDPDDPTAVIARATRSFITPQHAAERGGVTDDVCFVEGMVPFRNQWILYYGGADSVIFAATAPLTE